MNCIQTQTLLDAHADSELGHIAAFRVRRHLAGCAACAAQLADIQRLNASVHAWRDVSAPTALEGRIAAALPLSAAPLIPKRSFPIRPAAAGLAGVAAAVAAAIWFLPGQPGQPTIAFADVEQAMAQVQTLSWVTTGHTSFISRTGHRSETSASVQTWLRRKPAAIATFQQPRGYPGGNWSLEDGRGQITRYYNNTYSTHKSPANVDIAKIVEQEVQSMTQAPTENIPSHLSGDIHVRSVPLQEHETILNGRTQVLFIRDVDIITSTNPASTRLFHISQRTWVDPTTHRVTQIQTDNVGGPMGPGWRSSFVDSDFHYNQAPPPGAFDWSPPVSAKVKHYGPGVTLSLRNG